MATPTSLVSRIHSVLHSLPPLSWYSNPERRELNLELRNLNVLLVCLRNLGDDETQRTNSLFSSIEDAIGRILSPIELHYAPLVREVNCLAKEVNDEWCNDTMSCLLTLDDAVEIADSLLQSTADFWHLVAVWSNGIPYPVNLPEVMDVFKVQTSFLRDFLLFAKRTGVENQQVQNLLIHTRSFVLDAARVFQIDGSFGTGDPEWVEQFQSKCPRVDPQVFRAYTQTLLSMQTVDQEDDGVLKDFLGALIALLWHVLRHHRHPSHLDSLKALYKGLRLSRFILKQGRRSINGDFEDQIGVLIRDAGTLICSLYLNDVDSPYLSYLLQRFDVVRAQVPQESNSFKTNALDFGDSTSVEEVSDAKVPIEAAVASHQSSSTPRDVGFQEDEVTSILDRLDRGSKQLRLVPISGMAGIGKTTFALQIYNHRSVKYHFQACAWCTISQVFNKKMVLLQLLNQIQPGHYSEMTEDDLANKLRQSLKQRRYLILLDDVWPPQAWESLKPSFPDDRTQSRIVLTSRLHAIVPHALPDEQPHFLRLRNENECLEIIEMKLLHEVGCSTELGKFAKLCKGLPLTAVLVAGLLATTVQGGWESILDHLSSGGISGMEQCKIVLELSYKHLPNDLKLCFIYFGAFPEDEEIDTKKLIRLWMAEGFMGKKNDLLKKRIEDVAREYLDNLIQRNLVVVSKKGSTGGVKTCRIHDLLHSFCMMKGKQENLFHVLQQRYDELSEFNEPCNLERLSIHSTALHFKESRLFCPLAHSMLFFDNEESPLSDVSFIIQTFKLLTVLDMDQIWFSAGVPSEIALLTRLTYLSIRSHSRVIPSSIGKLSNLETLIIRFRAAEAVSMPHTIWDLQKLKYLCINCKSGSFSLPIENLEKSPSLLGLEVICGVSSSSDGSLEKLGKKFPNIRRLKCHILHDGEGLNKMVVIPECLSKLELLHLHAERKLQYEFDFGCAAENLRKVTLEMFVLSREEIAVIGNLPNLEVLKLIDVDFFEGKMEMEEGEFSELRILVLRDYYCGSNLVTWTATGDEQLPRLEKLVFSNCVKVREIPHSCLEMSSTLEEIEVFNCCSALTRLVRDIEEVQKDFGNLIKLQIYSELDTESEEEE